MKLTRTIRAPFPDEMPRVLRMLPPTPEWHAIRIAVVGRVERIAAAGLLFFPTAERVTGLLRFTPPTAHFAPEMIPEVLAPLLEEAKHAGAAEVVLVGSVVEEHPLGPLLIEAGFERYRQTEVYEVNASTVLERVEPVYQRLVSGRLIPTSARAIVPGGAWMPKLRQFLDEQQRTLSERLDTEEGFTIEHSLALIMDEEIKGAFFTRNHGSKSYLGLMLLDESLRGGLAWANTMMMREMLQFGISAGVEKLIAEIHPGEHRGSQQIVRAGGAELICKRWQFRQRLHKC